MSAYLTLKVRRLSSYDGRPGAEINESIPIRRIKRIVWDTRRMPDYPTEHALLHLTGEAMALAVTDPASLATLRKHAGLEANRD